MVKCPKCGKDIPEDSVFCPECGADLKNETLVAEEPAAEVPAPEAPVAETPVPAAPVAEPAKADSTAEAAKAATADAAKAASAAAASVANAAAAGISSAANTVSEAFQSQNVEQAKAKTEDFFNKNKKLIIIIGAALAAILIIVIILTRFSAKNVAMNFVKAWMKCDFKKLHSMYAYDMKDYLVAINDYDDEEDYLDANDVDSWNELYKEFKEDWLEEMDDEFGDYKIKYEFKKQSKRSEKKVEEDWNYALSRLEDTVSFDVSDCSAYKEVTIKVKIEAEDKDDNERETFKVLLGRHKGLWKVVYYDYDYD